MSNFNELGLSEKTLSKLAEIGFVTATEIQAKTIPELLKNDCDIIGQAQTGTGKTLAFGLPVLEMIDGDYQKIQALILTPTRELALQVANEIERFKSNSEIVISAVYGGQPMDKQIAALRRSTIVVGTPGRIRDHIDRKTLRIDHIKFFVLDEADEMLNMGFVDEIEEIMGMLPRNKRALLFSATMPAEILKIAQRHLTPNHKVIKTSAKTVARNEISQICYEVSPRDRLEVLFRVLDSEQDFYGIIFCNTKMESDELAQHLKERGFPAEVIHGDIQQSTREKVLDTFKKRFSKILIATDVAARGIDVQDLTHVINYGLPQDPESYVHRIGRTGRAGKSGKAITIIGYSDRRKLESVKRTSKCDVTHSEIPSIDETIIAIEGKLKSDLLHSINKELTDEKYLETAEELIEVAHGDPKKVIALILQKMFSKAIDRNRYREISTGRRDRGTDSYSKGDGTELFFAKGRMDSLDRGDIVAEICKVSGIDGDLVKNIKILDKFSFVTVDASVAEAVIQAFRTKADSESSDGRGRSLVSIAKGPSEGGDRPAREGGDRGGYRGKSGGNFRQDDRFNDGGNNGRSGGYGGGSKYGGSGGGYRRKTY